jgi:hypothetical protein
VADYSQIRDGSIWRKRNPTYRHSGALWRAHWGQRPSAIGLVVIVQIEGSSQKTLHPDFLLREYEEVSHDD